MSSESTSSGARDHLDELMEKLAESVAPRQSDVFLDQRVLARTLRRTGSGRRARPVLVLALSAAAMLIGSVAAAGYFGAWSARNAGPSAAAAAHSVRSAHVVSAPALPAPLAPVAEPGEPPSPAAVSDAEESGVTPATASAAELFASANQLRRSGQDAAAISAYRGLQQRYPASPEARLSRATLGTLLLQRGDASGALEQFDRYIQVGGPVLEEALAGRARALGMLGDAGAEARAWRTLLERFPGSVHAARARTRLLELR